ncbi:MAG: hypothetical protein A3J38_03130 [Gammaproteobacteria bacterium RIFCSPHIGHO2_12_FULL_45_9]|nr:MAG: hypothetical protein A3J38_03130 [Gammaproteobacteria bacterium RIFCSPHIGHO2_12_FULL_45_9]
MKMNALALLIFSSMTCMAWAEDLSTPALEAPSYSPTGLYLGGGLGYGVTYVTDDNASTDDDGFVVNPTLGYLFTKNWGLEIGYTNLPEVKAGDTALLNSVYDLDMAVKGILPINNYLQVFGKVGIAYLSYESGDVGAEVNDHWVNPNTSVTTWVPLFAGGVSYMIKPNLALSIQETATVAVDSAPSTYTTTIGLTHIF